MDDLAKAGVDPDLDSPHLTHANGTKLWKARTGPNGIHLDYAAELLLRLHVSVPNFIAELDEASAMQARVDKFGKPGDKVVDSYTLNKRAKVGEPQ